MASSHPSGDPRLAAPPTGEANVRPVVALPRAGPSGLVLGIAAVAAGALLFGVLESRRRALSEPSVRMRAADETGTPAPPPPLYIPRDVPAPAVVAAPPAPPPPRPAPPPPPTPPQIVYVPQPTGPSPTILPPPPTRAATGPVLVVDTSAPGPGAAAGGGAAGASTADLFPESATSRARAGVFANRATTVPQGTLIAAVLETAFDSTRPGFARAIVSSDVRGFDGSRVLIPRGSRLIGEYRSDAAPGQKRALVNWTRLIRPDGVTIAIGSPAGDPLGRGGVGAHVDNHFFQRFAAAILQSTLDVGINIASRAGSGGTTVVLPGGAPAGAQLFSPTQIAPTLTIPQGTSVSVFVARDLDFTGVESRR
jgi:type IV secretion system protein VirB10